MSTAARGRTRVLLDHELRRRADCGLRVLAAARGFGPAFVPGTRGPYDLVMAAEKVSVVR